MILELAYVAREPRHNELGAVPPGLLMGVDGVEVRCACLSFYRLRDLLPGHAGVDAVEDHGHPEATGVDHAGLTQNTEQLGGTTDRGVSLLVGGPDHVPQVR